MWSDFVWNLYVFLGTASIVGLHNYSDQAWPLSIVVIYGMDIIPRCIAKCVFEFSNIIFCVFSFFDVAKGDFAFGI